MPDVTPDTPKRPRVNPKARRERLFVEIPLDDGTMLTAKRLDMMTIVIEGLLPMPLLKAVQAIKQMGPEERARAAAGELDFGDKTIKDLAESDKRAMRDLMRRHAMLAVVDPGLVETDDGDDNHLPVDLLTSQELLRIWQETTIIPVMEPAAAHRFRPDPAPHDGVVSQPVSELRTPPESVARDVAPQVAHA